MKKVFIAKSKPNILNHGKKMLFQISCILSTKHIAQIVDCLVKMPKVCPYKQTARLSIFIFIDLIFFSGQSEGFPN